MKLLVCPFVDSDKPESHDLIVDVDNVVEFLSAPSLKLTVRIFVIVSGNSKLKGLGNAFRDARTAEREPIAFYIDEDFWWLSNARSISVGDTGRI
ncbi:hypothetical protein [Rhodopirellula sp. P2]|uniref:hypothetical protein n=1 Tax=Rhodopirellula sp. P2 TaxID=2127060 RepID=UPI002367A89F|nr:hypothetical protein [Rhodopirellula sp. P2]WDQ16074.1 hypothetical protein PSR62_20930 [Rhodopirellula sp. P2]